MTTDKEGGAALTGSLQVVTDDVFTADLPLGEARLVYADPPYMADDKHGYGTWPGAHEIVSRMIELGAKDASFILFCGQHRLGEVLWAVQELGSYRRSGRDYEGQPKAKVIA